jgi:hypothetical protein
LDKYRSGVLVCTVVERHHCGAVRHRGEYIYSHPSYADGLTASVLY